MKAYLVNRYKRPIEAGAAPEPTVGERDVLVDVHAAGVNLLDAKIRDGELPVRRHRSRSHPYGTGTRECRFAGGD